MNIVFDVRSGAVVPVSSYVDRSLDWHAARVHWHRARCDILGCVSSHGVASVVARCGPLWRPVSHALTGAPTCRNLAPNVPCRRRVARSPAGLLRFAQGRRGIDFACREAAKRCRAR